MELGAYLERVGFEDAPRVDLDTLTRLHTGHLGAIPYENLDVLLGRKLDFDQARIFDKLVTRRRGGWCYEMNGLLAWALEQIGFRITRVAGAVHRTHLGDQAVGNHLVLLVHLDQTYIADVGFGDGLHQPVPLREGVIVQHGFETRLVRAAHGWWRFHNHQNGGAPTFDFRAEPANPAVLARACDGLQTSDASPFTQNVVLQRYFPGRVEAMRNCIRATASPDRVQRRLITNEQDFATEMHTAFGIDLPEAKSLWPMAERRGREVLAADPDLAATFVAGNALIRQP